VAASPEQREVFRRALQRSRTTAGMSQRDLARLLDVSPGAVSSWEAGQSAPRPHLVTQMEQALELEDGTLGRLLGYLPASARDGAVVSVLEAVEADPRLGPRERELLAGMYDQLVRQRRAEERGE